jgi:hypothetical protein
MLETLERAGRSRRLGRVTVAPDPRVEAIVQTWPLEAHADRALALGLPRDESLDEIVAAYMADHLRS